MHKLGFHLPSDSGKLYVRIPEFWSVDILYNVALKLGSIEKTTLKFDESLLSYYEHTTKESVYRMKTDAGEQQFGVTRAKNSNYMIR